MLRAPVRPLLLALIVLLPATTLAQDAAVAPPDAGVADAAAPASDPPDAAPMHVQCGVYLNQIVSVDVRAHQYTVDFWLWFRWRGGGHSLLDAYELVGARINSKGTPLRSTLPDGVEYAAVRINATFTREWDFTHYPFDDHDLEIIVEDTDLEEERLVFEPDVANSSFDPEIHVSGWKVEPRRIRVEHHVYRSNYGDTTLARGAESHYSRVVFSVGLRREGSARFFKVFFGLFVATLVSWCGFLFRPRDAGSRVGISIGSLFAAAAGTIAVNAQLPEVNGLTLADGVLFTCLSSILFGLVTSVVMLRFSEGEHVERAKRVNFVLAIALPVVVLSTLVWIVHS